ncbi:uncharacterized protein LOC110621458 [Manihot esculenta]|uniref:uncharacterized protein LOC110621458 n=1 Tax=Manihot esculenta TaxID=3983 RepID=UPI000B5D4923|nr:uncharacterized protein LOC110621458 [Manihot esculenta]
MRGSGSEELGGGYCLEKQLRKEEADVDQKLERLREQLLAKLGAWDNSSPLLPPSSPFVRWVQQETILRKFMMPPMAAYDGTGNPPEHVLNYKRFMELQTHSNALMCKVFPTTLTGSARAWFNNLEARSIKNSMDLANVFISRFITGVPAERKISYLDTVRQRRNESLREYIASFNSKALQIFKFNEKEQRPYHPRIPEVITPLNVSRADVLVVVQDKDFIQWPKPMKAEASRRDPNKYCQYHRMHGHDNNDCFQLINKIDRLIKRGHLRNFVKKPEGQRPQQNAVVERPCRQTERLVNDGSNGTINMIVGGTRGRMSRRGKKRSMNGERSSTEIM